MADTIDSKCAERENSTDCLLRLLLQTISEQAAAEDAKFSWDPITFAFTVVIGLVATLFTLVTIYQATLAAGPGRRKCNNRAIGFWATRTKREWSWNDFNRLSIASTPVLRAEEILQLLKSLKTEEDVPSESGDGKVEPKSPLPAATWLRFLDCVGLEHAVRRAKHLELTTADYLTDDLLAVPAYADLGFIAAVAAASGAHTFLSGQSTRYPIILGDGFQFDFREHPTLGTIGAFSQYGTTQRENKPTPDMCRLAIEHARGDLPPASLWGFCFPFVDEKTLHAAAPIGARYSWPRHHWSAHIGGRDNLPCIWRTSFHDSHNLHWLLMAETPRHVPAAFPGDLSRRNLNGLTMLALNGTRGWLQSKSHGTWRPGDFVIISHGGKDHKVDFGSEKMTDDDTSGPVYVDSLERRLRNIRRGSGDASLFVELISEAHVMLTTWDEYRNAFTSLDETRRRCFRLRLLLQIWYIDRILEGILSAKELSARICILLQVTLALLRVEDTEDRSLSPTPGDGDTKRDKDNAFSTSAVFDQHSTTLTVVYEILNDFPEFERGHIAPEVLRRFRSHKYFTQIAALLDWRVKGTELRIPYEVESLFYVLGVFMSKLDSATEPGGGASDVEGVTRHDRTEGSSEAFDGAKDNEKPSTATAKVDDGPHTRRMSVDDLIILRAILFAALFWTAPDTSKILTSGVWNHVVPII
ncbi:hypothetical protein B0T16DRAFT_408144 [Cercophora newfieldiana]|uniref:Uncharacterized protein n=1 Tax=Cercophora newfieldiana TaxID=92897 RepID=A0AA39Y994_9PEZI|nr:hypothetical protein B0T16DRAFT_408144 [Cercophora newfieldiana]